MIFFIHKNLLLGASLEISFPRSICLSSAHRFIIVSILEHLTNLFWLWNCIMDLTFK